MGCKIKKTDIIEIIAKVQNQAKDNNKTITQSYLYDEVKSIIDNVVTIPPSARRDAINAIVGTYNSAIKNNNKTNIQGSIIGGDKIKRTTKDLVKAKIQIDSFELPSNEDMEEFEKLMNLYDQVKTPSEKAKILENAQNIKDRWVSLDANGMEVDNYNTDILTSYAYLEPLLSMHFTGKTIRSNFSKVITRTIIEYFASGMDGNTLKILFAKKGNWQKTKDVLFNKGVPQDTILQLEAGEYKSRGFVYGAKETGNKLMDIVYKIYSKVSTISSGVMSSVDAPSLNTIERLTLYNLYKNKIKSEDETNKSDEEVRKEAMQKLFRDIYDNEDKKIGKEIEKELRTQYNKMAEAGEIDVFDEDGNVDENKFKDGKITDSFWEEFKKLNRYKLAYQEARNTANINEEDEEVLKEARWHAKRDLWKTKMTEKSELGFGDTGIMGLVAQYLGAKRDFIQDKATQSNNKFINMAGAITNIKLFGFINGAQSFMEDKLEHDLFYSIIKSAILQHKKNKLKKGNATTDEDADVLIERISKLQKDLISKGAISYLTVAIYMAIRASADDDEDETWFEKFMDNDTPIDKIGGNIVIDGVEIPLLMSEQLKFVHDLTTIFGSDAEAMNKVYFLLQAMTSTYYTPTTIGETFKATGEMFGMGTIGKEKDKNKLINLSIDEGTKILASFFPFKRVIGEVSNLTLERNKAMDYKYTGKETPLLKLANLMVFRLAKQYGINQSYAYFIMDEPELPMKDYQGRTILHPNNLDFIGDGIIHNEIDDIYFEAEANTPYISMDKFTTPINLTAEEKKVFKIDEKIEKIDEEIQKMKQDLVGDGESTKGVSLKGGYAKKLYSIKNKYNEEKQELTEKIDEQLQNTDDNVQKKSILSPSELYRVEDVKQKIRKKIYEKDSIFKLDDGTSIWSIVEDDIKEDRKEKARKILYKIEERLNYIINKQLQFAIVNEDNKTKLYTDKGAEEFYNNVVDYIKHKDVGLFIKPKKETELYDK